MLGGYFGGTYDPNGRSKQTHVNSTQRGVYRLNYHIGVKLSADTYSHDPKIHDQKGPQSPIQKHTKEVTKIPRRRMVDSLHVMVMDNCIMILQGRRAAR